MRKEERYKGVLNWFNENVPVAETELHTTTRISCLSP